MGVRERTQSKRKPTQRKMKIPIVLLAACVASLKAASLMDSVFDEPSCQDVCCPTTTTAAETTTGAPEAREETTTTAAGEETTTTAAGEETTTAGGEETTTAGGEETTTFDCSACDACNPDNGAGSASMSL